MELRCAEISDFSKINELYEQLDKEHRVVHLERFQEPKVYGRTTEYKMDLITNPDSQLIVAISNLEIAGCIEGRIMQSPDFPVLRERKWLQVNSLVVNENHRCKGIGQALFDCLVKWSNSKGIESIELNVYSFNEAAIAFYRKNGLNEIIKTMYNRL